MGDYQSAMTSLKRPLEQRAQVTSIPAPVSGMNAMSSLRAMQPDESLFCYNILPSEYGLRTRLGFTEHTNGITGTPRTVIPYHGLDPNGTLDKLFVTGSDGIYDCTNSGIGAATLVYSFVTSAPDAGYGVYCHYVNDGGDSFLLYADSVNGLLEYDASIDTWAAMTGITFSDATLEVDIRFIMIHKQRLWMAKQDSTTAYYLPVASKNGQATEFYFGAKFRSGGDLVGLYNYTRDGGDGVDDFLISVSRGGDVIAWQGEDPAQAVSWAQVGTWYLGTFPKGRRVASQYGGDIFLLSSYGIITMGQLFVGLEVTDNDTQVSAKMSRIFRSRMQTELDKDGWDLDYHPAEGIIVVTTPDRPGIQNEFTQYVLNMSTKGWGIWRGIPLVSGDTWRGKFYFSQADGSVWVMQDGADNVRLEDPGGTARAIDFSLLTSYQLYETPGQFKIASFIRPTFVSSAPIEYSILMGYDYDIFELNVRGDPIPVIGSAWDSALWDQAVWAPGITTYDALNGVGGIGQAMAIAMRGSTFERVSLVEFDIMWQVGGAI